tara:strand:+ start:22768 stop:23358 length:591 start_codon:yes stop_codon:yes gene_type:complete
VNEVKQLWLLAGGKGSGKSTFYRIQLQPQGMPFVNADILAKELFPEQQEQRSYEAARLAEQIRLQLIRERRTFCFETVFSHPSKIDFVAQAKTFGYEVVLVFIHLDNTVLNNARVSQRVEEGGHSVPENKVSERIPRTLKNIRQVLPLCDSVYLLDNSRSDNPFKQIAVLGDGVVTAKQSPLPQWAKDLLVDYLAE